MFTEDNMAALQPPQQAARAAEEVLPRLNQIEVAAERLGVGRSKVYELMGSGQLRSVKLGKRRLIPESALIAFIDSLQAGGAD